MSTADQRKLQAYLDRPLDDLKRDLELYDPASRGPADVWNKLVPALRQRLCVEWDYCKVRQDARLDDKLTLAAAVAAVLSERALHLPVEADVLLLSAIVVKLGLDKFCNCP
jgi:hypothetical protein